MLLVQNCTADFKYTLKDCPSVLTLTEVNSCLHLLSVKKPAVILNDMKSRFFCFAFFFLMENDTT